MLKRKITEELNRYMQSDPNRILLIDGVRQTGKTYSIREAGHRYFSNFIEVNMVEDLEGDKLFADIRKTDDFYMVLRTIAGDRVKDKASTLVFPDEIRQYPHLLTLLKFLDQDNRFTYIASGSLPGVTLNTTSPIPMGNITRLQSEIHDFYAADASRYDREHKLKIRRICDLIPSSLESRKKRLIMKKIGNDPNRRSKDHREEFDDLISADIALEVKAVSDPSFPLEGTKKDLLKLYLNDVGILTGIYYSLNIKAILKENRSIDPGTVCESFAALPIAVRSGKDHTVHSAVSRLLRDTGTHIDHGIVLSNERNVSRKDVIWYLPACDVMFL